MYNNLLIILLLIFMILFAYKNIKVFFTKKKCRGFKKKNIYNFDNTYEII